jgi:hypothetical protein
MVKAFTAPLLCPQTRALYNGVYHYGALNASVYCASASFTSNNFYDVPKACTPPYTGCISDFGVPEPLVAKTTTTTTPRILHYVFGDFALPKKLDTASDTLDAQYGDWTIMFSKDITIDLGGSQLRLVRLMLLLTSESFADPSKPRFYLPVGQEIVGTPGKTGMKANRPKSHYATVDDTGGVTYHIILV